MTYYIKYRMGLNGGEADADKKRMIDQRLADAHITSLWYPEGEHNHVEEILQLLLE